MINLALQLTLSPATQRLVAGGAPTAVRAAVARAMDLENETTIGLAIKRRLTFPKESPATLEGLRAITSRLRKSLTRSPARIVGNSIISAIGSNVRYFGPHEFGFKGTVKVRAHSRRESRRFAAGDASIINLHAAARSGALTKRGAVRKGSVLVELERRAHLVRKHDRRVNLPARRMVQRTIEEGQARYAAAIEKELALTVTGGEV